MAEARDQAVWTNHAKEHSVIEAHKFNGSFPMEQWLKKITKGKGKKWKVLDFGCGSGLWKPMFDKINIEYVGADQNETMIEVAMNRYPEDKDSFKTINWANTGFEDGSIDIIFTSAVLQHNNHADKEVVVKEFARVLKTGGYYLFTENTLRPDNYQIALPNVSEWNPDISDGYSFTFDGWEKFLNQFGFVKVEIAEPGYYLFQKKA